MRADKAKPKRTWTPEDIDKMAKDPEAWKEFLKDHGQKVPDVKDEL
jgi:hypothetical protein